jgi:uncharacterized protein YkwD
MRCRPWPLAVLALGLSGCISFIDDGRAGGGSSSPGSVTCESGETGEAGLECRIVELVNEVRAAGTSCGGTAWPAAPALTGNSLLRQSARAHAGDMAENGYFSHTSLDGREPADRIQAAGYDWRAAGENIAAGSPTAEETMQQWLESQGHCENIMDPTFVDLGVGYAFSESGELHHYWVQNFGAPL